MAAQGKIEPTSRELCPICERIDYPEPELSHHLIQHPATPVTRTVAEQGWLFTANDVTVGPFTSEDMDSLDFCVKTARLLHVKPGEVWGQLPKQRKLEPLRLRNLDASRIGETEYLLRVQVVGESGKKALPREVDVFCPECKATEIMILNREQMAVCALEGPLGLQKRLGDALVDPNGKGCRHPRAVGLKTLNYSDYRNVSLRDPPAYEEDELDLADFRSIRGHVVDNKIPSSKLLLVRGRVVI